MVEPGYIGSLIRPPSTPHVEARPKTERKAPTGVFHNIDDMMSKSHDWWVALGDVEERDEAELDMKLAMGVLDLDDRALELEPMTIDAYSSLQFSI
jgi:hypothetical protein